MISVENLSKAFGTQRALDGLNLYVAAGEVYALLGANGAGKTTTINMLLGFERPDSGHSRVAALDPWQNPQAARAVTAYIPEQVALYPQLTGRENLAYFAALAGRDLDAGALGDLLQRVGLPPEATHRRLSDYSKGMRQKVGIAIALAKNAKVLLLDEPMSGLDPQAANEFVKLIRQVADAGASVLMATHDLFRARQMANRIGILRAGRKVEELIASTLDATQLQAIYLEHMEA